MALEIGDGIDSKSGTTIGAAQGFELAAGFGAGHPTAAIGRDAPTANHGINAAALGQRVLVAHQGNESAALARPESGGAAVIDAHFIRGQRGRLGEADEFKRIETHIDTAGQSDIQITSDECGTGIGDGQQR